MPLFVFCSGYFATNINNKKIITRLIFPFIIFQILYLVFNKHILGVENTIYTFTTPFWILWYLFSSILWGIIIQFFKKVDIKIIIIAFIIGLLVGFDNSVGYYLSLSRTIVFFPFYLLGYYFKKNEINLSKFRKNKFLVFTTSLLSLIVIYCLFIYRKNINIAWFRGSFSYEALDYNFVIRFLIYLTALILSTMVIIIIPKFKINKITNIGVNSLSVFLLHGFLIKFLEKIPPHQIISSNIKIISYLAVTTFSIVLLLASNKLNILQRKFKK